MKIKKEEKKSISHQERILAIQDYMYADGGDDDLDIDIYGQKNIDRLADIFVETKNIVDENGNVNDEVYQKTKFDFLSKLK